MAKGSCTKCHGPMILNGAGNEYCQPCARVIPVSYTVTWDGGSIGVSDLSRATRIATRKGGTIDGPTRARPWQTWR